MKNSRIFISLLLIACFALLSPATTFAAKPETNNILGGRQSKTESDEATLKIEEIVISFSDEEASLADSIIHDKIIQQVEAKFPLDTSVKSANLDLAEIVKKADLEAEKKFPLTREGLNEKYSLEAEKKFKIVQPGSEVTVRYNQGPHHYKLTGIFHGFTRKNDGIWIGRTIVPFFDLYPENKVRFGEAFQSQKKKDYVKKSIASYLSEKENYVISQVKSSADAMAKKNKQAGYIFAWQKWRTPKEVAEIIIKHHSKSVVGGR